MYMDFLVCTVHIVAKNAIAKGEIADKMTARPSKRPTIKSNQPFSSRITFKLLDICFRILAKLLRRAENIFASKFDIESIIYNHSSFLKLLNHRTDSFFV